MILFELMRKQEEERVRKVCCHLEEERM